MAIAGGITVWELWGKKAVESSQRTDRWGSDVGAAADKALGKFKNTSTGIQAALTDMDTATKTSTKSMADSFDREFSQMESDARKHLEGVKKAEKDMSPEVAAAVDREAQHEKDTMNKILSNADQARTRANTILQTSNKNIASLSDTQRVMLQNNQQQIVDDELKMWSLTGNQRKKAMAALNNDVANMSHRQRNTALADLRTQSDNMRNEYAKQENSLKRQLKAGTINQNEYAAGMRANKKTLQDYVDKASAEYIRLARANGQSTSRIKEDMQAEGLSYSAGMKQLDKLAKNAEKNSKSIAVSLDGLKGKTKDAAKMWNDLVFDPKTGKVRTNAQEEVNKAVNSKDKWNKIQYLAKHLKLSSNAGKMVAAALIENGKWNKMSWDQKRLYVQDKATQNVLKALEKSGEWNNLDLKTKEAIVKAKGKQEMADILLESGAWNSLSLKQQEAIIDAKGTSQLVDALVQANQWNNLTFKQQQALVTTKGTADVMDALNKIGRWNQLSPKQQEAIVNAKGSGQLGELISKYNLWKGMPASAVKQIVAEDRASGNLKAANDAILAWQRANPGAPKNALAVDNASGPMRNATGGVNVFANSNPGSPKNAQGIDSASGPMYSARNGVNAFAGSNTGPAKIAKANDKASGPIKTALDAIHNFMSIPNTIEKTVNVIFHKSKHAQGTNYHKGGLMEVNDQPGPVFRELVQFPGETPFIPYGRNVVFPAPRGTKVVKASDTAKMFKHLPQYANGTDDAVSVLTNFKPNMQSTQVVNNYNNGGQSNNGMQKEMLDRMDQMLNRFGTMLGLNAAQLSAIKAGTFDKNQFYGIEGTDQVLFDNQHL